MYLRKMFDVYLYCTAWVVGIKEDHTVVAIIVYMAINLCANPWVLLVLAVANCIAFETHMFIVPLWIEKTSLSEVAKYEHFTTIWRGVIHSGTNVKTDI